MPEFQELYEAYGKGVYRFLFTLTGDPDQTEELLQETFYQAFLQIGKFKGHSSLYTWLCGIGKNVWLKECRRCKPYAAVSWEELQLASEEPTAEAAYIQKETWNRVRQAILRLEKPYRDVLILHACGGVMLKEIARHYQKSESWARVTYHRAKQRIAQEVTL